DYSRSVPSLRGAIAVMDGAGLFAEDGANGRVTVVEDLTADLAVARLFKNLYEPLGARSCMVAPCERQGHWVGSLWVSCDEPRRWTPGEVELLRTVAERVWILAEESRAAEEMRQITADLQAAHVQLLKHAGELEEKVRERTAELSQANDRLQTALMDRLQLDASREQLRRRLASAHEEERRRISRELHDQMGQRVIALSLGLNALKAAAGDQETVARLLPALQELASQTGQDLHRVALELRQPALDDLGLTSAIQSHVRSWSRSTGIAADFQQSGYEDSPVSEAVETTLYRFVQEALNNVAKHADASQVSVILEHNGAGTQAIVEDNGCGFDVEAALRVSMPRGRLGLLGMRERLLLVGGTLNIESTRRGTTLFARIPPRRQDEKESQNSHSSR
ncbi:MAG TPA: GAF domain-containing sensor histidine kinase, partial [Terriglobia bacterium]|nr:GAF domain-containing sensor histidine kinase [Terriglobia bacterium]